MGQIRLGPALPHAPEACNRQQETLETDEENLAELQKRAESFERQDRLAILRLAGIAK